MKIICFILTLVSMFHFHESFESTDLCVFNQFRCVNLKNSKVRCERNECTGKWKIPCGIGFCSKTNFACQMFKLKDIQYENRLKSINKKKNLSKMMNEYLKFKQNISQCPATEIVEWYSNDVCFGDMKCGLDCDCPSRLNVKCNDFICAQNENVCVGVMEMLLESLLNPGISAGVKLNRC